MSDKKYRIHIFEIDEGKKKAVVQYDQNNTQVAFEKFKTSVRKGRKPVVLNKRTKELPEFDSAEAASVAALEVISNLEQSKYHVISGTTLQKDFWQLYVIELDNNPMKVYVGQSIYNPEIRFEQHMAGLNSSVKVRRANSPKLRPDLYSRIGKLSSKELAQNAAIKLATKLREQGFTVYGAR